MARGQVKKGAAFVQSKAPAQPKVSARAQGNDIVFALDIGTRSIIGMVGAVEDGKVNIIGVEREEHTERAMIDGQIENIEKVSSIAGKVKKRLEAKTHIQLERVCVAAAGRALKTKRADYEMELPGTQLIDDEIISRLEAGAITKAEEAFDAENEAREDSRRFYLVGYTVCQYYLDQYMISNLKDHRGRHIKVDLIATFLPSEVVESLYTTMNKIGLEVASLTLEPIAAVNAAIPENIRLLNLVLVDIGAGTSDIAACTGGSVTGYTMATMAGDEITETIMKQYLVDFSTAEAVKAKLEHQEEIVFANILGMEQKFSREEIFKCIQGAQESLSKEIADKVVEINGTAPSALFLAGGGSRLAGLKEAITAALGMDENRVAVAGNYFQANAYSKEYDLNNPEYATPLGIAISSGLNMINDSFRVILNNRPAKLFRSGTFTALNLLMMNGFNFRDIMGRAGANLTVTVNGARKVFYGTASEPASLFINQKEGKLSDIIHAGDVIEFVPATQGEPAKPRLGDIEGARTGIEIMLNGKWASLNTFLKNNDAVTIIMPEEQELEDAGESETPASQALEKTPTEESREEQEGAQEVSESALTRLGRFGTRLTPVIPSAGAAGTPEAVWSAPAHKASEAAGTQQAAEREAVGTQQAAESKAAGMPKAAEPEDTRTQQTAEPEAAGTRTDTWEPEDAQGLLAHQPPASMDASGVSGTPEAEGRTEKPWDRVSEAESPHEAEGPVAKREMVMFHLNGSPLYLPKKEDGRPYYLMDLIQHSGIDLDHPKGVVTLQVNGEAGRFQQVLRQGDTIYITEEPKNPTQKV